MSTTTPTEIRQTIIKALDSRARECRTSAAARRNAGAHMAHVRAALRGEAKRCEDLQRVLGYVAPEALAAVLESAARELTGWTS